MLVLFSIKHKLVKLSIVWLRTNLDALYFWTEGVNEKKMLYHSTASDKEFSFGVTINLKAAKPTKAYELCANPSEMQGDQKHDSDHSLQNLKQS